MVTPCCHPAGASRAAGLETAGGSGLASSKEHVSKQGYVAFKGKKES